MSDIIRRYGGEWGCVENWTLFRKYGVCGAALNVIYRRHVWLGDMPAEGASMTEVGLAFVCSHGAGRTLVSCQVQFCLPNRYGRSGTHQAKTTSIPRGTRPCRLLCIQQYVRNGEGLHLGFLAVRESGCAAELLLQGLVWVGKRSTFSSSPVQHLNKWRRRQDE